MANVTFVQCVVVDGVAYATVAAAQTAILTKLFPADTYTRSAVVEFILAEREAVLAALMLKSPTVRKRPGRPAGSKNKTKPHDEIPGIQPKAT